MATRAIDGTARWTVGAWILLICLYFASPCLAKADTCVPQSYGGFPGEISTRPIQRAIDHCSKLGGDVVLSKGVWVTGPLLLKSHVTLVLRYGSVLMAEHPKSAFVPAFIGSPARYGEALILANDATHVGIEGAGQIVGNGAEWWPAARASKLTYVHISEEPFKDLYPGVPITNGTPRPWLVEFNDVADGFIHGVTLRDSPMWTLVIRNSHNFSVDNVDIKNPDNVVNTDGIDVVSSHDVTINDTRISNDDDDISIKSGLTPGAATAAYNVRINNCTILHGWGIAIGSGDANGIGRVVVSNTRFIGTNRGIVIKSARDRGNRIGPFVVRDVVMNRVRVPIFIGELFGDRTAPLMIAGRKPVALQRADVSKTTPFVRAVTIHGLIATGADAAMLVSGLPEAPVRGFRLTNVRIDAQFGASMRYVRGIFRDVVIHVAHGSSLLQGPGVEVALPDRR